MKAAVTVKENYEFRRIYRKGKSLVSPQMVLYWQKNRQGQSRLGITRSTYQQLDETYLHLLRQAGLVPEETA